MRPQTAQLDLEPRIRNSLENLSQGQLLALVHAKLTLLEDRRTFERERAHLSLDALHTLAAHMLAGLMPATSGRSEVAPPAGEGSGVQPLPPRQRAAR